MKNYFTISEFAKLRNININSLRYYEKLGVLKPKFIDPITKYRYYTPEQLADLDIILLCISLEIPLKRLAEYIDEFGSLQHERLLEDGRRLAQQKINEVQAALGRIEYSLGYLEDNKKYMNKKGHYTRIIPDRFFVISECGKTMLETQKFERISTELYSYAQEKQLSPVLPTGLLIKNGTYFAFFEIVNGEADDDHIMKIPSGEYSCVQVDHSTPSEFEDVINQALDSGDNSQLIVSNMVADKFGFGARKSELQRPVTLVSI